MVPIFAIILRRKNGAGKEEKTKASSVSGYESFGVTSQ